jgi:hypothetical protein
MGAYTGFLGQAMNLQIPEGFVCFGDWGRNIWWHRFCRPGFRHVMAFGYDARAGVWVIVDSAFEALLVSTIAPEGLDALVAEIKDRGGTIVKMKVLAKGPPRPRLFATCVTQIGHLLGLPRCAVRPWGLYRMLLASGAVPAFERVGAEPLRENAQAGR